nr:MAG TPA: hypothetical protein [Caudoviricetes sp.]
MQKFIKRLHFTATKFVCVAINPYICNIKKEIK